MPEQTVFEKPILKDFIPEDLIVKNLAKKLSHVFDEDDCYALWAAYSAGRPLLVRGKPGTGKSQMAKAIAETLGWSFVSEVIQGGTELSDLHWHFDAIGRLGEAQLGSTAEGVVQGQTNAERLDPLNFLSPGAFWWAYNPESAKAQYKRCSTHLQSEPEMQPTGGVVLLLDEMDKAEPDLPNGLLETLGQYQFSVPYIDQANKPCSDQINAPKNTNATVANPIKAEPLKLLVIITTNEERELPSAFVRRCFVHTLKMEESREKIEDTEKRYAWLITRGKLHFGTEIAEEVYESAAELLWKDRTANMDSRYPPGLAEYIDLLAALVPLPKGEQAKRLARIAGYALQKEVIE